VVVAAVVDDDNGWSGDWAAAGAPMAIQSTAQLGEQFAFSSSLTSYVNISRLQELHQPHEPFASGPGEWI